MPRVRLKIPDPLLQVSATRAQELGVKMDDLYAEALARYCEVNADTSPGALRSRSGIPVGSPSLIVEIPDELFERAEKLAKRLGKRRDMLYTEALARHISPEHMYGAVSWGHHAPGKMLKPKTPAQRDVAFGHDAPAGAWRPPKDTD